METRVKVIEEKRVLKTKKRLNDVTAIREHLLSLDNETIKKNLIASGIYDENMKLTASFR